MPVPAHDVDTLRNCFRDLFGCPGREFGSRSRGVLGISDGNKGVQWNAGYPSSGVVWFGVNLEGMKYDGWPVARLIERELSRPLLLTPRYRLKVAGPGRVTARWTRDAWRHPARPPIKEADIAPTPIALDRLDRRGWEAALEGAMECLDPLRQHRGRGNVQVTLLPSKRHPWERRAEMGVSPHLKIRTPLAAITPSAMRQARDNLHALYEFVAHQSRA